MPDKDLIKRFALKNNPFFQRLSTNSAYNFQLALVEAMGNSPEFGQLVKDKLGISSSEFIGALTSGTQSREQIAELFGAVPRTPGQKVGQAFIEEPIRGMQDVFAAFGLGEGGGPQQKDVKKLPNWIPIFGGASAGRTVGSIGLNLLGFSSALKGTAGVLAGLAKTSPRVASTLSFSGASGGLEAASQLGRKIATGEELDPRRIISETAIGAAAGLPANRILAAGAAAGTAATVPPVIGSEFNPERVASETIFALLFGNPRIQNLKLRPKASDFARSDIEKALEPIPTNLPPQIQQLAQLAHQQAKLDPTAAKQTAARAEQIIKATQYRNDLLAKVANDPVSRDVGQVAADALAVKTGKTRPVDAPGQLHPAPKPVQSAYGDPVANALEVIRILRKEEPMWRAVGAPDHAEAAAREIFERQLDLVKMNRGHADAQIRDAQVRKAATDEAFGAATPMDKGNYEISENFRQSVNDLDNQILRRTQRGDSPQELRPLMEAREVMQQMMYDSLKGFEPKSIADVQTFGEMMYKSASTKAEVGSLTWDLNRKWPGYSDELTKMGKLRAQELLRSGETRAINAEIETATKELNKMGIEIASELDEAAAGVAGVVEASGISKGDLRKAGGVSAVIDHLSEVVPSRDLRTYLENLSARQKRGLIKEANKLLFKPKPANAPLDFPILQKEAFKQGVRLTPDLTAHFAGYAKTFKSLKAARKWIGEVADGVHEDPLSLRIAAAKRAASVKHIGDGEYLIHDHVNQTSDTAGSIREASSKLTERPDLSADAPELVPGAPGMTPGIISRAGINGEDIRLDGAPEAGKLPGLHTATFRNLATLAQDIESVLPDVRMWHDHTKPLLDAERKLRAGLKEPVRRLNRIKGQVRGRKAKGWWEAFLSPRTRREQAKLHDLNGQEVRAMADFEKWLKQEFDVAPAEFIDLVQNFRRAAGDPARALPHQMLPAELEFARADIEEGHLRLDNDNPWSLAYELLRSSGNDIYVKPILPKADEAFNLLAKKAAPAGASYKNWDLYKNYMSYVRRNVLGHNDAQFKNVSDTINSVFKPLQKAGLMSKVHPKQVDQWLMRRSIFFSGAAMSVKPALTIRNFFQSFLPAMKVGMDTTWSAHREAVFNWRELQKHAIEAGALDDLQGMYLFNELENLDRSTFVRMQSVGLIPYRTMDTYNRMVSFAAGRKAIEKWAPKLADNKMSVDNFLIKTGLAGDPLSIQREVFRLINSGDMNGAANYYGRKLSDSTQFLYSRAAQPAAFQGTVGRLVGQFGTWPMQYTEWMAKNLWSGGRGYATSAARSRYRRLFALRWGAMYSGLTAAGLALGIDTSSYNFANPLDFEGGPAIQSLRDLINAGFARDPFEKKVSRRNLARALSTYVVPFQSSLSDIQDARDSERDSDAVLSLLGFNPIGERRRRIDAARRRR